MSKQVFSFLATGIMIITCMCFVTQAVGTTLDVKLNPVTKPKIDPNAADDNKTPVKPLSQLIPLSAKIAPEKTSLKQPAVLTVHGGMPPYTATSSSGFLTVTSSGPNTYQVTQTHNATGSATLKVKDSKGTETSVPIKMALTINIK